MTLANNGLGFFHGSSLLWEQFPAAFLVAHCQGLSGSTGHHFPFLSCFSIFSGSVFSSFFQFPGFTQITQQCLPIAVVLKLTEISRFAFQYENLIPKSDFQI